ncbi:hypothetical protein ScPMuIL_008165 [Solemya velum]
MEIYIISDGEVFPYLQETGLRDTRSLYTIPSDMGTVNLTWEAGDDEFSYWFDDLRSLNMSLLYNPLLSIPASGIIPTGPTVFQMSIPCTGKQKGVATLILGLQIFNKIRHPIRGSPIKIKLKKECEAFVTTTLCKLECRNNGRCDLYGECICAQGFRGKYCEIAMCSPPCEHNGTCTSPGSPGVCRCQEGYYGPLCERELCTEPCQNGGKCIVHGFCWCTSGYYGDACEMSYCMSPCRNGGTCIGDNKCQCAERYTGELCEKRNGLKRDVDRPRRSKNSKRKRKKKRRQKKKIKRKRRKKNKYRRNPKKGQLTQSTSDTRLLRRKKKREKRQKKIFV